MNRVEILLSTFNGAKYLDDLITSIINQDYEHCSLVIRDDRSSDHTIDILHWWRNALPNRIVLLNEHDAEKLGSAGSFSRLIQYSTADHIMLADQDDVWRPAKVRETLAAMRLREERVGPLRPIIAHTDLTVVDADLRVLSQSYWRYQGIVPSRGARFSRMMVENTVRGCTAMLNRALVDAVGSIPAEAGYHDWWIALVASALGDVVLLNEQPILWRRHGSNESEISSIREVIRRALGNPSGARRRLARLFEEGGPRVAKFLELYRDKLQPDQVSAAEAFLNLSKRNVFGRRADIIRHELLFTARLRNAGLLALI
jgi:glycosyltransferase involved in cell wall biosynthesis